MVAMLLIGSLYVSRGVLIWPNFCSLVNMRRNVTSMRNTMFPQLVVVVALASAILSGCQSSLHTPEQRAAIQAVIANDNELGAIRNAASETGPLADAVRDYVAGMDGIDFSKCPAEFTEAFQRHRDVWEQSLPFFEQHLELRGEMHDLFNKFKADPATMAQIDAIDRRIWDTWAMVERATQ